MTDGDRNQTGDRHCTARPAAASATQGGIVTRGSYLARSSVESVPSNAPVGSA